MQMQEHGSSQRAAIATLVGDKLEALVKALDEDLTGEDATSVLKLAQAYATLTYRHAAELKDGRRKARRSSPVRSGVRPG